MNGYSALLFDLDDTLLDREKAVENIFLVILNECYEGEENLKKSHMLSKFKEYDKRNYGLSDKVQVVESFFVEFPLNIE